MLILPIETENHEQDALIVVLESSNIERMKSADPAEIILRETGRNLVNPTVMVCVEEHSPEFNRIVQSGNIRKIIEYLQRGWKFRPERGDHDRGPENIGKNN